MKPDAPRQSIQKPPFFWLVLLLGIIFLGFFVFDGIMIYRYGTISRKFGWNATRIGEIWKVTSVDPQGPAAGKLQIGDRIVALNDDTRVSRIGPNVKEIRLEDSSYTIGIERDAIPQRIELPLSIQHDHRNYGYIFSYIVIALAFGLIGLFIGLSRPDQPITRLASLALLAPAFFFLGQVLNPMHEFFQGSELTVEYLIRFGFVVHWALAYHFYYRFLPGIPKKPFWTAIQYILYGFAVALLAMSGVRDLFTLRGDEATMAFLFNHDNLSRLISTIHGPFQLCAAVAIFAVIVRDYLLVRSPDERRRIVWVIYGAVFAFIPLVMSQGISFFLRFTGSTQLLSGNTMRLIVLGGNLATISIPITSGYAILKHRTLDINVVVRQGLKYLLAKNVLQIILVLPIVGLVVTIIANPHRTIGEILFGNSIYFYVLAVAALGLKFRGRLREWLDRKFFREAYHQEKILLKLIDEIKQLDSMPEISRLVSQEVETALHPKRILVFYREQEKTELTLGYSSAGHSPHFRLADDHQLLLLMEKEERPLEFPFRQKNRLDADEEAWLVELGINLIVPMHGSEGHLAGLVLMGEKKSEAAYTATDCKLLQTIAAQMAVVYENVRLKERVHQKQKTEREVLARFEGQKINLLKECPSCGTCYDSTVDLCTNDNSQLNLTLPVERTIEGKYRLDQLLGKGGMGAVYAATDLRLNRKVAIKIMIDSMFGDRLALRRFEREARTAAKLNHPNIIAIYDFGGVGAEGAYLVMELLHGNTLRAEIDLAGRLAPDKAADWFDQVLEGIKAAHQNGVIHRDLKPENILIAEHEDGRPFVKILDFGLAKVRLLDSADSNSLTAPGTIMGTLGYMSPEQLSAEEVDERSDIFSLGVMVAEALTGRRPFRGKTPAEILTAILKEPFHLESKSKEVQRLNLVLQKCLAKNRTDRFLSVSRMQKEVIPAIRNCRLSASDAPNSDIDTRTFTKEAQ